MRLNLLRLLVAPMLAGLCLTVPRDALAQRPPRPAPVPQVVDSTQTQVVKLRDGTTLLGRVVAVTDSTFQFRTQRGELTIRRDDLAEIRLVRADAMYNGQYAPNPHVARLFFAPTGRMLDAGEGYFSDIMLFFMHAGVGASPRFTMGFGASVFPTDNFIEDNIFYVTPKVGVYHTPTINVAVGALAATVPSFGDGTRESVGILYAVGTFGAPDLSFTTGVGWGYDRGRMARQPMFMAGGEARISRRASLVTENYLINTDTPPGVSYGIRFFGEKLSVDLALMNVLSDDAIFPGFPFVGFAVRF